MPPPPWSPARPVLGRHHPPDGLEAPRQQAEIVAEPCLRPPEVARRLDEAGELAGRRRRACRLAVNERHQPALQQVAPAGAVDEIVDDGQRCFLLRVALLVAVFGGFLFEVIERRVQEAMRFLTVDHRAGLLRWAERHDIGGPVAIGAVDDASEPGVVASRPPRAAGPRAAARLYLATSPERRWAIIASAISSRTPRSASAER